MFKIIRNRVQQGYKTSGYPREAVRLPESFRGRPRINAGCDPLLARSCAARCPQEAIDVGAMRLDLGRCVFCGLCERLSQGKFIQFTNNFEMAVTKREDLITDGILPELADLSNRQFRKLFGRSLQIRQVSAGGCNSCEADTNVLNTPFFDLSRFGIQFVASPRHADAIHVTGPISKNMRQALLDTYAAVPEPKLVIAAGSCALSGGPFRGSDECIALEELLPIDLYIPGCPPHPMTTLHALLQFFK